MPVFLFNTLRHFKYTHTHIHEPGARTKTTVDNWQAIDWFFRFRLMITGPQTRPSAPLFFPLLTIFWYLGLLSSFDFNSTDSSLLARAVARCIMGCNLCAIVHHRGPANARTTCETTVNCIIYDWARVVSIIPQTNCSSTFFSTPTRRTCHCLGRFYCLRT